MKFLLKNKQFLAPLKTIVLFLVLIVLYFILAPNNADSFDWIANIFISYLSLIFLDTFVTKKEHKTQGKYIDYRQLGQTGSFVYPSVALAYMNRFIEQNNVGLGVFLTFDIRFENKSQNNNFIEHYVIVLLKLMLQRYHKIFVISPNYCYSVLIQLEHDGDRHKSQLLNQFHHDIVKIVDYINDFLSQAHYKNPLRVYYSNLGHDFFDLSSLVYISELGIYNHEFIAPNFCVQFDPKVLRHELQATEHKLALKRF